MEDAQALAEPVERRVDCAAISAANMAATSGNLIKTGNPTATE
jgi:hypothetical protein